ncbi:hypothetical protein [Halegenticoccus soli]|uniref:hypothetical protein n=1 Tax=Halegenticoccus soli TaxID=1985678 RepID=UPI001E36639F|nr:hypothetical protein [Halegenticoccus soli]
MGVALGVDVGVDVAVAVWVGDSMSGVGDDDGAVVGWSVAVGPAVLPSSLDVSLSRDVIGLRVDVGESVRLKSGAEVVFGVVRGSPISSPATA